MLLGRILDENCLVKNFSNLLRATLQASFSEEIDVNLFEKP